MKKYIDPRDIHPIQVIKHLTYKKFPRINVFNFRKDESIYGYNFCILSNENIVFNFFIPKNLMNDLMDGRDEPEIIARIDRIIDDAVNVKFV